jgi:hypothetical protein
MIASLHHEKLIILPLFLFLKIEKERAKQPG